ncbi:MAG: hypothetical protein N3A63_05145 [Bacteroidetes bacterium]|nr:hypothetical protein [Bacteroidota bacterium]
MYERSLNAAEEILKQSSKPLMSVRELWNQVVQQSKEQHFDVPLLPDFTTMLDGDPRFQIIPARQEGEDMPELSPESGIDFEEMERLGFYPEDRVRLKTGEVPQIDEEELPISEEEEEVGSIRRRAFVDQVSKEKKRISKKKHKGRTVVRKPQRKQIVRGKKRAKKSVQKKTNFKRKTK